MSREKGSSADI